jgi:NADPH:quinone reductase-like Zn-dependent oxidoreductase
MLANGKQLREITSLIDAGVIRPIIDKVYPFDATNEALAYVESGRAKGKVVVKVKQSGIPALLSNPELARDPG